MPMYQHRLSTLALFTVIKGEMGRLLPCTMPSAVMDSGARHPPPKCHPDTRLQVDWAWELDYWRSPATLRGITLAIDNVHQLT